jgi:hypothetical protein
LEVVRVDTRRNLKTERGQIIDFDRPRPKLVNDVHNLHQTFANRIGVVDCGCVVHVQNSDWPKTIVLQQSSVMLFSIVDEGDGFVLGYSVVDALSANHTHYEDDDEQKDIWESH